MQAYALQKVLQNLGHDVITIDRRPKEKNLIKNLLLPLRRVKYNYLYSGITNFIKKNIKLSEPIYSDAEMKTHFHEHNYDLVIVGSDQVWRPGFSLTYIYNFFLDFLENNHKGISYAASFGVDNWEFNEEQTQKCRKLIKKFKAISVRESSAIELLKNNLSVEAELVLDPTLLITAKEYESQLFSQKSGAKGKVLKYLLDESKHKKQLTAQVTKHLGKPIFSALPTRSVNDFVYPNVESWVTSFRDADYVITDSFHGCIFSIIFNKPFIAIGNHRRGLTRFDSLLSLFGLSDRLIANEKEGIQHLIDKEINWEHVNLKLAEYQYKSISFLKTACLKSI